MDLDTVYQIASLARLKLDQSQAQELQQELTEIVDLADKLAEVNTDHVEPLAHPYHAQQPLREDIVSEPQNPQQFLANAPSTSNNCYLVPKVLEKV